MLSVLVPCVVAGASSWYTSTAGVTTEEQEDVCRGVAGLVIELVSDGQPPFHNISLLHQQSLLEDQSGGFFHPQKEEPSMAAYFH